jgi:hypothetical protein
MINLVWASDAWDAPAALDRIEADFNRLQANERMLAYTAKRRKEEIERLRKENLIQKGQLDANPFDHEHLQDVEQENARLQELVKKTEVYRQNLHNEVERLKKFETAVRDFWVYINGAPIYDARLFVTEEEKPFVVKPIETGPVMKRARGIRGAQDAALGIRNADEEAEKDFQQVDGDGMVP